MLADLILNKILPMHIERNIIPCILGVKTKSVKYISEICVQKFQALVKSVYFS